MKLIQIYIFGFFILFFSGITFASASADNREQARWDTTTHTQHPPHDHHHTDHIKKLDEGMRRKRKDEENSH
jgi:hypothetical protein